MNLLERLENARWFRDHQERLGMTNSEMADELCCDLSHIGHMRSGRRSVTAVTMKLIRMMCREKGIEYVEPKIFQGQRS